MAKKITFVTPVDTYAALKVIGEGGSGRVYEVKASNGQRFALKLLNPAGMTGARQKRFTNELNFGRRLRHDNTVSVVDAGEMEVNGITVSFFLMPLYHMSLRSLLDDGTDPRRLLRLFDGVFAGVDFAHSHGVVHRDLKPENILFDSTSDRLVVADFGIAHFEEELLYTAVETRDGDRLANFQYAAPEQRRRGGTVDHRADIYAVGLMLNEVFTGSVPQGTGYRRIQDVDASQQHIDEVVERMIRADPNARYPSIQLALKDIRLLSVGPALAMARKVGGKVSAAEMKSGLFRSTEGVELASRQVIIAYEQAGEILDQVGHEVPSLKLEVERAERELVVRTARSSARVNWYYDYSNSLEGARVTIWTYKWRVLLPSEQKRRFENAVQPVEISETAFFPDYVDGRGFCWRDELGNHIGSRELGDRLVTKFMDLVDQHETSDEQMPWR